MVDFWAVLIVPAQSAGKSVEVVSWLHGSRRGALLDYGHTWWQLKCGIEKKRQDPRICCKDMLVVARKFKLLIRALQFDLAGQISHPSKMRLYTYKVYIQSLTKYAYAALVAAYK